MLATAVSRIAHLALATTLTAGLGSSITFGETLDGVWDISMIVSDGRVLDADEIRRTYSADGRIAVTGQTASLLVPSTLQKREIPMRVNGSRTPALIDVALAAGAGGHGVVMVSGNTAVICITSQERPRATTFASQSGSGNLLISLTRATGGVPGTIISTASTSAPRVPQPMTLSDDQLRALLVGTWGHQDKDTQRLLTMNSDGTMSAVVTWKDQFKKIFHSDVRSSGTWKVENGVVVAQMTASTDKNVRGQIYSYRIRTINDKELTAIDQNGQMRQEWKVPGP